MKKFSCLAAASLGAALSFLAWTSLISEAQAVPISIQNPGFDDNSGVNANGFDNGSNNVAGWRDGGSSAGGGVYASASANSAPNVACTGPGLSVPFQITNYVIQAGDVFTVTYYATAGYQNSRASVRLLKTNLPFTGGFAPLPGGAVNATLNDPYSATTTMAYSSPNTTATWTQYTLTYTATAADAGRILGVAMDSAFGGYPNYDTFALGVTHSFVHPGISHSQSDLDRMKNNYTVAPYNIGFAAFAASDYSQTWNEQGPYASVGVNNNEFRMRNDGGAAHNNALMWYITGNTAYRDHAIKILMDWANTLTSFDANDHLTAADVSANFSDAAEILRKTSGGGAWPTADITKFQNWMLTYLAPALLTPGNAYAGINHVGADGELEWSGHGITQIQGLVYMGIFCDRPDLYSYGVMSMQRNANRALGLQEYINTRGVPFSYETERDCGHPSGALGTYTGIAYAAWNQGVDLFAVGNNLLAQAYETQAKVDMNYEVAPTGYQANDGGWHGSISADNRTATDGLKAGLTYRIYHDIKGLNLPYTFLSASLRGVDFINGIYPAGSSAPVPALYGAAAPSDVVAYNDNNYAGGYLVHLAPGSYNTAALQAAGMVGGPWGDGHDTMRSIKVPAGWTVTIYASDNFTGSSVQITSSYQNLGAIGWSQRSASMVITGAPASAYKVANGTYKLVNRNSGKIAQVTGASTATGANVAQGTYASAPHQLWRVENVGANKFLIQNLGSDKAMEIAAASLANGGASSSDPGNVDQATYVPAPNLATGGIVSASSGNSGNEGSAMAFDGNPSTKWNSQVSSTTGWLQYQFPSAKVIDQYTIVTASDMQERDPAAWQFLGSNNGTTWTTLDTQSGQVIYGRGQTTIYSCTNTTAYTYYRLNITANYGGSNYNLQLGDLGLYASAGGGIHQRWTISAAGGSAYGTFQKLLNVNSGKALDVYGNSTADGANIMQWTDNGGNNQQWSLQVP